MTQPSLFDTMQYQTKFSKGDVILREQEYVTILGVRHTENGAEYKIRDKWLDAALIDRNCESPELNPDV